jgi:hypothetical protein
LNSSLKWPDETAQNDRVNTFFHRFSELFAQLGLPASEEEIRNFITQHAPLPDDVRIEHAPFWSVPQARLLRELLLDDSDWSEMVDQLSLALRSPKT